MESNGLSCRVLVFRLLAGWILPISIHLTIPLVKVLCLRVHSWGHKTPLAASVALHPNLACIQKYLASTHAQHDHICSHKISTPLEKATRLFYGRFLKEQHTQQSSHAGRRSSRWRLPSTLNKVRGQSRVEHV